MELESSPDNAPSAWDFFGGQWRFCLSFGPFRPPAQAPQWHVAAGIYGATNQWVLGSGCVGCRTSRLCTRKRASPSSSNLVSESSIATATPSVPSIRAASRSPSRTARWTRQVRCPLPSNLVELCRRSIIDILKCGSPYGGDDGKAAGRHCNILWPERREGRRHVTPKYKQQQQQQ